MDCFAALAMTCRAHLRILAAHCARGLPRISRPLQNEGAGNAGRPMRPIAACAKVVAKRTRVSRSHRNHPTFRTQWFTAYLALSSVRRAFWPPSSAEYCICRLDSSVGEPGPHDFARPPWARFVKKRLRVHRSPPRVVDVAQRPSVGWDGEGYRTVCRFCKSEYFLKSGSTGVQVFCPSGRFVESAQQFRRCRSCCRTQRFN
jgi:hypothetical protein